MTLQGVKSEALVLPRSKTAEPNSGVAFKDPCRNLKPKELETVAHLEDRLSQQLAYIPRAERANSTLCDGRHFCFSAVYDNRLVCHLGNCKLKAASTIELNRNI